jgi:flagellar basal-body rod protein FlgB
MDLDKIALMNMLDARMKYGAARQEALSQNIANADTPDYKRRDVDKPSFKGMVKTSMLNLETTSPNHISGTNSSTAFSSYSTEDKVELDMEAIELMKNGADFARASTTYKKMLSLFRTAVGGGNQ